MAERFRGEYDAGWSDTATAVKQAAGNRCVRCGHPNGDRQFYTGDEQRVAEAEQSWSGVTVKRHWFDADGEWGWHVKVLAACDAACSHPKGDKMRVLTVHHLDGHKANDAWWNLLALCQVCHLQVQAKVIPERQFLFQHSAWFVPYVCGFYAHYYGGVTITREQAEAEPDRYLAMGQPWLYTPTRPEGQERDQ